MMNTPHGGVPDATPEAGAPPGDVKRMPGVRPRVGVLSCLLGEPVRYNGGHSRSRFLTGQLSRHVDWVPFCPEIELGLGAPRAPLRLTTGGRLVSSASDEDHTAAVAELVTARRDQLGGLSGYIFTSRSPSCGLSSAREHSGGRPVRGGARGAFAGRVLGACPMLPAEEEGRLNDPVLREAFVEQIFARARLLALFSGPWRLRDLVSFHSRHKLQLLAHDPVRYRESGRLVAAARQQAPEEVQARYMALYTGALSRRVTTGRHVDALHHAYGMVSGLLDQARRHGILAAVGAYRRHEVPLSVPVALIRHHAVAGGAGYLADQTYLDPFPASLGLRNYT
jgi:uncharacterized protein YbgA (DUF1722 family)/uncharacterized protein YbbK (DUF523 family)